MKSYDAITSLYISLSSRVASALNIYVWYRNVLPV